MRARSVCPSVPYACFLRGGPPVSGTSSVGLGAPRQTHMLPTLDHPKRARSGHMRGDPATRTARGAALDPVPYRPRARGRAFRQPLCLVSTDALQSRCPAPPAAGRTRPPGGRKASSTRRTSGALPGSRWLGGEVRTALGSAIFPGNWWPRAVPSVPGSAPQPPARSIGMRWLHRRTAWTAAPRRTAPDPRTPARVRVLAPRALAMCSMGLTTARTHEVHM